jgi:hypothetical protein
VLSVAAVVPRLSEPPGVFVVVLSLDFISYLLEPYLDRLLVERSNKHLAFVA